MFKKVIVGVDERGGGRDAIALAQNLVDQGGILALTNVITRDPYPVPGGQRGLRGCGTGGFARGSSSSAHSPSSRTRAARPRRPRPGPKSRCNASNRHPAGRGLHELAEAEGADLIVVGYSRRGLLGRALSVIHPSRAERRPMRSRDLPAWLLTAPGQHRQVSALATTRRPRASMRSKWRETSQPSTAPTICLRGGIWSHGYRRRPADAQGGRR